MFFLKYEFQDKDFKSVVEFGEAVTAFMNDFIYWFNNLGAWVDSVNARKEYIFGQLGWELNNGKKQICIVKTQLKLKLKMRHLGPSGQQIQPTGDN